MRIRPGFTLWARALVTLVLLASAAAATELPSDVKTQLENSKYVYVASTRKDGSLSKPAEIWYMYRDGAVFVGTPRTTWRVKRIAAGRPAAQIAVGKPDGPSFAATGAIVKDAALQQAIYDTFAKKYPDGWLKYEQEFRRGFADGSRVLVKYTPR